MLRTNKILLDQAGEGTGGGGTTSIIASAGAQGQAASAAGDSNSGQAGSSIQAQAGASAANAAAGSQTNDWRLSLPKELQEDASLKKFNDLSSLAAGYVNLQKLVGKEKLTIPDKHATDDDWKNLFHKIGLPQDLKDYAVNAPENASIPEEFLNQFKTQAHQFGVLPNQAQKLINWFNDVNKIAETNMAAQHKATVEKSIGDLKTEWGDAYQLKLNRAFQVANKFGGEELISYLDKTGLGNDTKLIKLLATLGEEMSKEGKIVDANSAQSGVFSPAEAKLEVEKIMGDKSHPYFDKSHPGHKSAVDEVSKLYQMMTKK